jgi:hypothetical protein
VRSPGGYEWWYFDAEDNAGQLRLVAGLCEGFVFHPGYLRRYYQYLARPTFYAPPLPGEYPCAFFAIYDRGRVLAEYLMQARPEEFQAGAAGPEVTLGSNQLSRDPDGALRLRLSDGGLSGELLFQPRFGQVPVLPALTRDFLSRKMTGADHRWIIPSPMYSVKGEMRLTNGGTSGRTINFAGRGFHDHHYGSAPLGPGLRRWICGRVLWDDKILAFHYARPRRRRLGDELTLLLGDSFGMREVPVALARTDWSGRTAMLLRYPTRLHLRPIDANISEVRFESPRVIRSTPYQLRLTYQATFGERSGQAFCEVGYPRRLTWPLVGRVVERSIEEGRNRGG